MTSTWRKPFSRPSKSPDDDDDDEYINTIVIKILMRMDTFNDSKVSMSILTIPPTNTKNKKNIGLGHGLIINQ